MFCVLIRTAIAVSTLVLCFNSAQAYDVVDFQPFKASWTYRDLTYAGQPVSILVTDLNQYVNRWFLVEIRGAPRTPSKFINIEIFLNATYRVEATATGLRVSSSAGTQDCPLWQGDLAQSDMVRGSQTNRGYFPICGGLLWIRNQQTGKESALETKAEWVRQNLWGGESLVNLYKTSISIPRYQETAKEEGVQAKDALSKGDGPRELLSARQVALNRGDLGIQIATESSGAPLIAGRWYPARNFPGAFASVYVPNLVPANLMSSYPKRVAALEDLELRSMVYMVALELPKHSFGWAHGTNHPGVQWSDDEYHPQTAAVRGTGAGPDGFSTRAPLTDPGYVPPPLYGRLAALFSAGFQRKHGLFSYGKLAQVNRGSYWGFIEEGVTLSTLWPGLATFFTLTDGTSVMKTWETSDNALLGKIQYARQNAVPLIEGIDPDGTSRPGELVSNWGEGSWSGSVQKSLRSQRSGGCIQETGGKKYFIYAYFSYAAPSAMARVFQGLQCSYAMHFDMNSPFHAYFALTNVQQNSNGDFTTQFEHLTKEMAQGDFVNGSQRLPRYMATPDFRDFFFVLKR